MLKRPVEILATPATWVPGASARKGRARAGTRTCAGRRRASHCAAGAGSAAATSAPALRASLARSTGPSASATTSPAPGTKVSSAHTGVGCHALLQGIFPTQGLKLHLCLSPSWLPQTATAGQNQIKISLSRSKLLRFRFSGTLQGHRLG